MAFKVSSLRLKNIRCFRDVTLPLDGLTVLVGPNGGGKSTIIECLAILGRAASSDLYSEVANLHGGRAGLAGRRGPAAIEVTFVEAKRTASYELTFPHDGRLPDESLALDGARFLSAEGTMLVVNAGQSGRPTQPLLQYGGREKVKEDQRRALEEVREALSLFEVHVPPEVTPAWVSPDREPEIRRSVMLRPVDRLSRRSTNLVNVLHTIKNQDSPGWAKLLDLVHLGLGEHIQDIVFKAETGSRLGMWLQHRGSDDLVQTGTLSDGQLHYLAFVALYCFPASRTLLAYDDPDLHLHPALISRVTSFLEGVAQTSPVVVATQSDRLLDSLSDPAKSVRVCEQDEDGISSLRALDRGQLEKWLEDYRGLGDVRSSGYLDEVVARPA